MNGVAHHEEESTGHSLTSIIELLLRQKDQEILSKLLEFLQSAVKPQPALSNQFQSRAPSFGVANADLEALRRSDNQSWTNILVKWLQASLYTIQGRKEEAKVELEEVFSKTRASPNLFLKFVAEYHLRQAEVVYYASISRYKELGNTLRATEALFFEVEKCSSPGPNSMLLQLLILHLTIYIRLQLLLVIPNKAFQPRDTILIALGKATGANKLIALSQSNCLLSTPNQLQAASSSNGSLISISDLSDALTSVPERKHEDLRPIEFLELLCLIQSIEDITIGNDSTIDGNYHPLGWDLNAFIDVELALIELVSFWFSLGPSSSLLSELQSHFRHIKRSNHNQTSLTSSFHRLPSLLAFLLGQSHFRGEAFSASIQQCEASLRTLSLSPDSSTMLALTYLHGQSLYAMRDFEASKLVFERLVESRYRSPQVLNYLGVIELRCRRPRSGLALFKKAVAEDIMFLAPLYNISRLYNIEKRYDLEMKALKLVLRHVIAESESRRDANSMFRSFALDLADSLSSSTFSSTLGSTSLLDQFSAQRPTLTPLLVRLRIAQNFRNSRQHEAAIEEFLLLQSSQQSDPTVNSLMIRHELARTYLAARQYQNVLDLLSTSHDDNCPDVVGLSLLAEASLRAERHSEALHWLQLVVEIVGEARKQLTSALDDFTTYEDLQPASKRPNRGRNSGSFLFRGHKIASRPETSILFFPPQRDFFELDMYNNLAATYQCNQEYVKAMETFSKALAIARNLASRSSSPSAASKHLKLSYYNYCLLAFKLGKLQVACFEWIRYRFNMEISPSSHSLLQNYLKLTSNSLQNVAEATAIQEDIAIASGEVPEWSILQLDKTLLQVAMAVRWTSDPQ